MNMQLRTLWPPYKRQLSTTVLYLPIFVPTMFPPVMLFFIFDTFQKYLDNPAGDDSYTAKTMVGIYVCGVGMTSAMIGMQAGIERVQG